MEYLELVAKVRFGLCVAADMFCTYYCVRDNISDLKYFEKKELGDLLTIVKELCHDKGVKTEPAYFLVKQIVRQYGFHCLERLLQMDNCKSWILPAGFNTAKVIF